LLPKDGTASNLGCNNNLLCWNSNFRSHETTIKSQNLQDSDRVFNTEFERSLIKQTEVKEKSDYLRRVHMIFLSGNFCLKKIVYYIESDTIQCRTCWLSVDPSMRLQLSGKRSGWLQQNEVGKPIKSYGDW